MNSSKRLNKCPICLSDERTWKIDSHGIPECKICGYKHMDFSVEDIIQNKIIHAHNLRNDFCFYKAKKIYEEVKKEVNENEELLCELTFYELLCLYGVEIKTLINKRIKVICHYQMDKLESNSYYKEFMRYKSKNKDKYRDILEQVEQERLLMISAPKENFEIFICTKVTDSFNDEYSKDNRTLTVDYEYASKIYDYLTSLGYKVFLSEKIMPSYTGNYYGYLFNALKSSKMMIVVFSNERNLTSSNVALEWEYFKSANKPIKPVYVGNNENEGKGNLEFAGLDYNQSIFSNKENEIYTSLSTSLEIIMPKTGRPTKMSVDQKLKIKNTLNLLNYFICILSTIIFSILFELNRTDYQLGVNFLDNNMVRIVGISVSLIFALTTFILIISFPKKKNLNKNIYLKLYKKSCYKYLESFKKRLDIKELDGDIIEILIDIINNIKYEIKTVKNLKIITKIFEEIYKTYGEVYSASAQNINQILSNLQNSIKQIKNNSME